MPFIKTGYSGEDKKKGDHEGVIKEAGEIEKDENGEVITKIASKDGKKVEEQDHNEE